MRTQIYFLLFLFITYASGGTIDNSLLGNQQDQRVFNGVPANLGDFPFFAYLTSFNSLGQFRECGGSFIRHDFILTSAHCVYDKEHITIYGGLVSLSDSPLFHYIVTRELSQDMIVHEFWSDSLIHINNIGLIRMRNAPSDLLNGIYINAIALPTQGDGQNSFEGFSLRAMGFGLNGAVGSSVLRSGDTRVILNSQCETDFPFITPGNVCIEPIYGPSPCDGDDGGPGMVTRSGQRIVLGVFSGGHSSCTSGFPAVYVRVTNYLTWIHSHMN